MYPTKEDKMKWWLSNLYRYQKEMETLEQNMKTCVDAITSLLKEVEKKSEVKQK